MAYKVNRSSKITEQLELGDEKIIDVEINVTKIASDFNKAYNNIIRAQIAYGNGDKSNPEEVVKVMGDIGNAVISLFDLVFGEDAVDIIDFYKGDHIEMMLEVVPFINDVIVPRINEFVKEKKQTAAKNYKFKQKRKFFG